MNRATMIKLAIASAIALLLFSFYELHLSNEDFMRKVTTAAFQLRELSETNEDLATADLKARRKIWNEMMDLSKRKEKERVHRLPDVVGIGIQKCGTGALLFFLGFHPYMRTLKNEAKYYGTQDKNKGLEYYKNKMPVAAEHEIVMEKTPSYFEAGPDGLPTVMHTDNPDVKLILLLCNPVQRALSAFAMAQEKHGIEPEKFEDHVDRMFGGKEAFQKGAEQYNPAPEVVRIKDRASFIKRGAYVIGIGRWLDEFDESQLKIINGEKLITNPGEVIEELQDFIGIPKVLRKEDFVRHPSTGMYCVRPWWKTYDFEAESKGGENWTDNLLCMSSKKGRSRSKHAGYKMPNRTSEILREYYRPYNEQLYTLIGENYNW